jgi:hypothetical protein
MQQLDKDLLGISVVFARSGEASLAFYGIHRVTISKLSISTAAHFACGLTLPKDVFFSRAGIPFNFLAKAARLHSGVKRNKDPF